MGVAHESERLLTLVSGEGWFHNHSSGECGVHVLATIIVDLGVFELNEFVGCGVEAERRETWSR